jgi:hypothetical protein
MTDLLGLSEKLQDTVATLATMEAAYLKTREDGIREVLSTLQRRQAALEAQFADAADVQGAEVCRYRVIKSEGAFPISVLADSLRAFQGWLTIMYDAVAHGPKARSRVSAEVAQQSTLNFGYAFPGSVGFVLTIPNDRLLIGETDLDRAVSEMFDMLRVTNSAELREYSRKVGIAPIRKMHEWVNAHAKSRLSVDIKWARGETPKSDIIFQAEEAAHLAQIVESTSDETVDRLTMVGVLAGGDLHSRSFHLSFPETKGVEDIRGYLTKDIVSLKDFVLGKRYIAEVVKNTITQYSTEQETTNWELAALKAA